MWWCRQFFRLHLSYLSFRMLEQYRLWLTIRLYILLREFIYLLLLLLRQYFTMMSTLGLCSQLNWKLKWLRYTQAGRQASQFIMNINIWIYACVLRQGNKRSVIIFISHIQRCVCVWNFFCSTRTTCQVWKKYLCKNVVQDARR